MAREILLVDDDEELVSDITELFESPEIKIFPYTDFRNALDYVVTKVGDVYACFVDMKPIVKIPGESEISDAEMELLKLPEEIFYKAKSRGWAERFYFISAHRSWYDNQVLERTGAGFISKGKLLEGMKQVLNE